MNAPEVNRALKAGTEAIKRPVRLETSRGWFYLIGADNELILSTYDSTQAEMDLLVRLVNAAVIL